MKERVDEAVVKSRRGPLPGSGRRNALRGENDERQKREACVSTEALPDREAGYARRPERQIESREEADGVEYNEGNAKSGDERTTAERIRVEGGDRGRNRALAPPFPRHLTSPAAARRRV